MKKIFALLISVAFTLEAFSQVPEKMSYQAVIRNISNALVTTHLIGMRISILQGSANGPAVYTETQTPRTNANGLVSVEIGGGAGFNSINWASHPYFLKIETDPAGGTSYTITGVSQVLSVPYALSSKKAETADYNDLTNKPVLFDGYWASLAGKPSLATVATSGSYNDLFNKPNLFDGTWTNITGKPTTLAGYGITNGISISHVANGITSGMITNWNTAYGWGNHSGLYKLNSYVPNWFDITGKPTFAPVSISGLFADLLSKPTTLSGYGITNAMSTAHPANVITATNIANWTTAFGWGNHASAGYQLIIREVSDEFTANASQTSFTLTQAPSVNSKVKMFINGVRISNTAYSNSGNTLTYNPLTNGSYALKAGDRIQFDYFY